MAPGVSSDDGSMRSRSVRCGSAGAAAKRELRRPKQETLDQLNMTMMSTKEVAGKGARGLPVDINDNLRPEESPLPPSPLDSSGCSDTLGQNQTFFPFELSLKDFFREPEKGSGVSFPYIETELVANIKQINRPIGITLLINGCVVVGDRGKDLVIMYDTECDKMKEIQPGRKFKRPSDMVTLPDGRFAVRDDYGLQLFDEEGAFIKTVVPKGILGMCFGLATDGKGNIYTINTNKRGRPECMTKKGDTDILIISVESGLIVEQIQLEDIIEDKKNSQCKFLHCDGVRLYISDLGLNVVYVMELMGENEGVVKSFGKTGKRPGQFKDVAGIAADTDGNVLVVDACNNRIQVFNANRQFLGMVKIPGQAGLRRPSGIALDMENETLYVLNLWSNSLSKFKLVRP